MSTDIRKSQSNENLKELDDETHSELTPPLSPAAPRKRGRKLKYFTDEERIEARRQQQRAYRERKKREFEELKLKMRETNLE